MPDVTATQCCRWGQPAAVTVAAAATAVIWVHAIQRIPSGVHQEPVIVTPLKRGSMHDWQCVAETHKRICSMHVSMSGAVTPTKWGLPVEG